MTDMKQHFVDIANEGLKPCKKCGGKAEIAFDYNDVWESGAIICHSCDNRLEFLSGNQDVWDKKRIWNS